PYGGWPISCARHRESIKLSEGNSSLNSDCFFLSCATIPVPNWAASNEWVSRLL
ncbi:hypothetical protein D030_0991B, partial [Vibrio parahaemolyticus AQ3810]